MDPDDPQSPLRITSIAEVHAFVGQPPPAHPHVSVIGAAWQPPLEILVPVVNRKIVSDLYAVSLKRGDECRLAFGRQVHDAQAGTVGFLAPGQTVIPLEAIGSEETGSHGWTLMLHPDLLVGTPLGAALRTSSFFQYAQCEALHLTEDERETLTGGAREHIHRALIEAAKLRLAGSRDSVAEVAYALGFEQPQHFSRLFKQKTGQSPGTWRG